MEIVKTVAEFRRLRSEWNRQHLTVSLVPTMGALHDGHLSLLEPARTADRVVVSIFVNPKQFGPDEDFQRYPRSLERDLALLEQHEVDTLFVPEVSEIYPADHLTSVTVDELSQRLCGISRPMHFRGVTTVVLKLLNIIQPHTAVFGQKDAQQTVIVRRMVRDLNLDVKIVVSPIVREQDGLALSSRNQYLSMAARKAATVLFHSLQQARQAVARGEHRANLILEDVRQRIMSEPLARLDYAEIVDPENLNPVNRIDGRALLALAVFFGATRLIDNTFLEVAAETDLQMKKMAIV
jgi:pantoate--beta-alanine ligase